jgi:hypothetical protein
MYLKLSLLLSLLCACASDFSPTVAVDTMTSSDPSEDPAEEDSTFDPEESSSDDGSTTGDSDDGSTTTEPDSTDTSGDTPTEPPTNPGPGEPCDPFAAFEGTAPCDGDPETPSVAYTCVPAMQTPTPDDVVWEFRCVAVVDTQGDGDELSNPCSDDGGSMFAGCMNALCLSNGLSNDPAQDVYQNHPPIPSEDACPFVWWSSDDPNHESGGYYVKACCSDFCDANHPCDAGWTCVTNQGHVPATLDGEAVGACVWQ